MGGPAFEPNVGFDPTDVNAGNTSGCGDRQQDASDSNPRDRTRNHRWDPLVAADLHSNKSAQKISAKNQRNT